MRHGKNFTQVVASPSELVLSFGPLPAGGIIDRVTFHQVSPDFGFQFGLFDRVPDVGNFASGVILSDVSAFSSSSVFNEYPMFASIGRKRYFGVRFVLTNIVNAAGTVFVSVRPAFRGGDRGV